MGGNGFASAPKLDFWRPNHPHLSPPHSLGGGGETICQKIVCIAKEYKGIQPSAFLVDWPPSVKTRCGIICYISISYSFEAAVAAAEQNSLSWSTQLAVAKKAIIHCNSGLVQMSSWQTGWGKNARTCHRHRSSESSIDDEPAQSCLLPASLSILGSRWQKDCTCPPARLPAWMSVQTHWYVTFLYPPPANLAASSSPAEKQPTSITKYIASSYRIVKSGRKAHSVAKYRVVRITFDFAQKD
jgi:hypothetical protein